MKDKILKQIEEDVKLKLSVIISNEVMSGNEKQEAILKLFGSHNNIKESVELPSVDEAGVMALNILESVEPKLNSPQEAFFISGFCECVKLLKSKLSASQNTVNKESVDEKLELSIRTKLDYLESISEFTVSTDTVRAWIDLAKEDLLSASQNTVSNSAIDFVKSTYVSDSKGLPSMLLGDVAELIRITTGKTIDWNELESKNTVSNEGLPHLDEFMKVTAKDKPIRNRK